MRERVNGVSINEVTINVVSNINLVNQENEMVYTILLSGERLLIK